MNDALTALFEILIDGLWKGALLAALVWCVLQAMPRLNATTRYAIWYIALLAIVVAPFLVSVPSAGPSETRGAARSEPPAPAQTTVAEAASPDARALPVLPKPVPVPVAKPSRRTIQLPSGDWPVAFLGVSAFIVPVLLLRLLIGLLYIRWLKRTAEPAGSLDQDRFLALLNRSGARRRIRLLVSAKISTPVALGFRHPAVVIPASLAGRLTESEFDQLALHEIAHVNRRDDWTNLGQKLISAIFYFHPAVHWVARRLDLEREIACDDWVIARTGQPRPYAACLAKLAELTRFSRRPILASGAIGKKQILRRVEMLLDSSRNAAPALSRIGISLLAILLLMLIVQLSRVDRLFALPGEAQYRISDGVTSLEVRSRGIIEFTDDERDVRSISPGGFLGIEQRRGWSVRRLEIFPGDQGSLERRYTVSGQDKPFDAEAKELLSTILPQMARESGANVPQRVRRILEQRGPAALLDDIGQIHSAHSRSLHLAEFIGTGKADTDQLRRAMRLCGDMHSDSEKSKLLVEVCPVYLKDGLRHVLFEATGTMHSDSERRRALGAYLERDGSNRETLIGSLDSAAAMHSDNERAHVLTLAIPSYSSEPAVRRAFFGAVDAFHSDNERRRVLAALLELHAANPATLADSLRAVARMNSDNERASVLSVAAKTYPGGASVESAFFDAIDGMHSDSEKRRVLTALLEKADEGALARVARAAQQMHSDQEKAQVLVELTARYRPALRQSFFEAAGSMHSSSERRRVLITLLARPGADTPTLVDLVHSAEAMPGDQDKAEILGQVAERHGTIAEVRAALLSAAESVHSRDNYRRIVQALVR